MHSSLTLSAGVHALAHSLVCEMLTSCRKNMSWCGVWCAWCGTLKTSVCAGKTLVSHETRAFCRYTRRRFESTHAHTNQTRTNTTLAHFHNTDQTHTNTHRTDANTQGHCTPTHRLDENSETGTTAIAVTLNILTPHKEQAMQMAKKM